MLFCSLCIYCSIFVLIVIVVSVSQHKMSTCNRPRCPWNNSSCNGELPERCKCTKYLHSTQCKRYIGPEKLEHLEGLIIPEDHLYGCEHLVEWYRSSTRMARFVLLRKDDDNYNLT